MVMTGLIYDGIARVPTIHGSELMLKFSMSSLTLSGNAVLTVTKDGNSLIAESGSVLELSGNVVLYATKLSADLDGIRVTFVPSRPLSRLRPDVTLTNVVADQPFATADSLWKIDRPGRETYLASVRKRPDSGLSGPPGIRRIRRTISSPRRRSAAAPSPE